MHYKIVTELFTGEDEKTETLEQRGGGRGGDKRSDKQWKCQGEEEGGGEEVQSDQSGQGVICGLAVSWLDNWLVTIFFIKPRFNKTFNIMQGCTFGAPWTEDLMDLIRGYRWNRLDRFTAIREITEQDQNVPKSG